MVCICVSRIKYRLLQTNTDKIQKKIQKSTDKKYRLFSSIMPIGRPTVNMINGYNLKYFMLFGNVTMYRENVKDPIPERELNPQSRSD